MRHSFPFAPAGQSVGLFGGSFDPPHSGHVHISSEALKRFRLDQLWWLVAPQNPLKARGPAPLERRIDVARTLITDPRIKVTGIEAQFETRFTAETLAQLIRLYPGVRFVWLMGADNLAQFHRWQRWDWIMQTVPIGVLARPGQRISARTAKASQIFAHAKWPASAAKLLAHAKAPAWCFVNVPMVDVSSTQIRARGDWGQGKTDDVP